MKSIILKYPKGLSSDIMETLNPISHRVSYLHGIYIVAEFIGVNDNWQQQLISVRNYDRIEIISVR